MQPHKVYPRFRSAVFGPGLLMVTGSLMVSVLVLALVLVAVPGLADQPVEPVDSTGADAGAGGEVVAQEAGQGAGAPNAVHQTVLQEILDAGHADRFAIDWLEQLCDSVGPRLAGSDHLDAAAEYAVRTLREAGFDTVWTEPVAVPHWVRGREEARIVAPVDEALPILGLGGSVGTPANAPKANTLEANTLEADTLEASALEANVLEANVLVVGSFDELEARAAEAKGRIVLFDPPWEGYGTTVAYRTRGASEAARHGAVAVLIRSVTPTSLRTLHTGVMHYAEGIPQIPAAAVTIEDAARMRRLAARGITVRVRLSMGAHQLPDRVQSTVLAEVRGRELPDELVVAGCHLDSWDVGTGAHDDGAGCAIVAGAAHLLIDPHLRPKRTIRVVLYASEEYGGHAGSAYLEAHEAELDRHVAALESDSGCFAPDGFSVKAEPEVVEHIAELARPLAAVGAANVRPGWAGVDIGPIVERGVLGIAHRTANDAYFNYHHSPADTFDKVDPADLDANVAAVAGLLWLIAEE